MINQKTIQHWYFGTEEQEEEGGGRGGGNFFNKDISS
jgi:hypothetical protein